MTDRAPECVGSVIRGKLAMCALLLVSMPFGCDEVFSDYEFKTVTVAEPVLLPAVVFAQTTTWLEVHVHLEGGTASVQSHELDGRFGVALAFPELGWFPGACPADDVPLESDRIVVSRPGAPFDSEGRWVFCSAVRLSQFETSETIPLQFTFWNGLETVKGRSEITVYPMRRGDR